LQLTIPLNRGANFPPAILSTVLQKPFPSEDILFLPSKAAAFPFPEDPHNRFNLLAEYLFESRLSESFTASALLRNMIEGLLYEYRDGLVAIKSGHIKRVIPVVAHGGKALYVLCSYAWVVRPRISSKFLNHLVRRNG
jgi:hypothetical protein